MNKNSRYRKPNDNNSKMKIKNEKEKSEIVKELNLIKSSIVSNGDMKKTQKEKDLISIVICIVAVFIYINFNNPLYREVWGYIGLGIALYIITSINTRYINSKNVNYDRIIKFIEIARPLYLNDDLPKDLKEYYILLLKGKNAIDIEQDNYPFI